MAALQVCLNAYVPPSVLESWMMASEACAALVLGNELRMRLLLQPRLV